MRNHKAYTPKGVARMLFRAFESYYAEEVLQSKLDELVLAIEDGSMGYCLDDEEGEPQTKRDLQRVEFAMDVAYELEEMSCSTR